MVSPRKCDKNLLHAAKEGNLPAVRRWILAGANINCQDENGATPMMLANLHHHHETICELMARGASITILDKNGFTSKEYSNGEINKTVPLNEVIAFLVTSQLSHLTSDEEESGTAGSAGRTRL